MNATRDLTPELQAVLTEHLGDAKPATGALLVQLGKSVRDRLAHDHATQREDWYCMNLAAFMGERMGPVLRRLLDDQAEGARLRTERDRYRVAWQTARTRALSVAGAADRAGAWVRESQKALQDMVGALLGMQMERDALRSRVAELEQVQDALRLLLPTEPCRQEGTPVEQAEDRAWHEVWELVAEALGVTLPYEPPAAEDPVAVTPEDDAAVEESGQVGS